MGDGGNCLELGFSSNLLCSSCRELKEFSLGALEADCKRCCQAEGVASDDKVCVKTSNLLYIDLRVKISGSVCLIRAHTVT